MRLRLANIQGNVTPGFRSEHQAFLFVRLPEGRLARRWLGELQPQVTSAEAVATFLAERRRGGTAARVASVPWINLAFSRRGLERLGAGARSIAAFPEDFRQGLAARAEQVGDDRAEVAGWEVGGTAATEADAVVLLAAGTAAELDLALGRERDRLAAAGGAELRTYRGRRLPGPLRDFEHFGFRDGVSQPDPADPLAGWPAEGEVAAPGEFILGYPDELGRRTVAGPSWAVDGSYLVFRRLRQDVFRFRQTIAREARRAGLRPAQLAAKLLGRWPSGAKLGAAPDDPGADGRAALLTATDFASDPEGERCPRFAHVRKAHPRELRSDPPARHRLIRRGIPYGPPLPPAAERDDGEDRGLLFLAYQASLARQFEHVQRRWLNDVDFPQPGDGPDPLAGGPVGPRTVRLRQGGRTASLALEPFVSVTAGGYFFAPSLRALAHLADPGVSPDREETGMPYQQMATDLGEFIFEQNPYSPQGQLRIGFQAASEIDEEVKRWEFAGQDRRVSRAIRVEYSYRDADGLHTAHLLIGYEGGSGN